MTRGSILEYTEVVRWRYLKAGRVEKGRILDEYVRVTGYHRKAAIRLMRLKGRQGTGKRRGRRRSGSPTVPDEPGHHRPAAAAVAASGGTKSIEYH